MVPLRECFFSYGNRIRSGIAEEKYQLWAYDVGVLGPGGKEEDPDRKGHDAPDIFAHGATPSGPRWNE